MRAIVCVVRATNAKGWAAQVMADVVAEHCQEADGYT